MIYAKICVNNSKQFNAAQPANKGALWLQHLDYIYGLVRHIGPRVQILVPILVKNP